MACQACQDISQHIVSVIHSSCVAWLIMTVSLCPTRHMFCVAHWDFVCHLSCCVTHCDCVSHLSCIRRLRATLVMYSLVVCHSHHVLFDPLWLNVWLIMCCMAHFDCVPLVIFYMTVSCSSFVVWPIVTVCHTHHVVWSISYDCAVHCMTHCDCVSLIDPLWLPCRSCIQVMRCMTHYGVIQVMCCVTHYGCHTGHVLYDPLWLL